MAKIESVEIKNADGTTSRTQVGSKAYTSSLEAGGSVVSGSGVNQAKQAVGSTQPVQEVGVISSKQGLDAVKTAQDTEARLSPIQPIVGGKTADITTPEGQKTTLDAVETRLKDFVTYINPETEQEQTLQGNAITDQARKTLEDQGYVVSESNVSSPEITQAEKELSNYQKEVASYVSNIRGMLISDNDLRGEIASIEAGYNARQQEMEDINQRRQATIKTLGVRTGMRYTGGSGGIIGGIISEEERQGAMRIADLEAQKMAAVQGAKKAAREYNFTLYTTLMADAQDKADKKYEEVQKLKEEQQAYTEALVERERQSNVGLIISAMIDSGQTDRSQMYTALNDTYVDLTGGISPEDFKKTVDALMPTGTGIIGEYEYYKREAISMGQTPLSFNDYQTADANRKRPVVNVGASGMPNTVVTQVDKISSSFDASPIVKQYNEVLNKKLSVDGIISSGVKGPADLALVFEFMKALDPTSVVRESEYDVAAKSGNIFSGVYAKYNGYMNEGGGFLPEKVRSDFQTLINTKFQVIDRQYENLKNEKARLIEQKTSKYDPNTPGSEYLIDYAAAGNTADNVIQNEQQAQDKLDSVYSSRSSEIEALLRIDPNLSAQDMLSALGI